MIFLFDLASHLCRSVEELLESVSEDELCWWWARSEIVPLRDAHGTMQRLAASYPAAVTVEKKNQIAVRDSIVPELKK